LNAFVHQLIHNETARDSLLDAEFNRVEVGFDGDASRLVHDRTA
jgi:hypothetical protein